MTRRIFIAFAFVLGCAPALAAAQDAEPVIAPWTQKKFETLYQPFPAPNGEQTVPDENKSAAGKEKNLTEDQYASSSAPAADERLARLEEISALEALYSRRSGRALRQFGYDLFGAPQETARAALDSDARNTPPPMGEAQDDFTLSAGDEIEVVFTGQRTDRANYRIDSRGMLMIPDFPPIPAEGRSIGAVRVSVQAAADAMRNTQAYVSLASVRQINVLVIGHVRRPGRQNLTVFHSAVDALMQAGGAQKTGSLRQIRLVRGGKTAILDLYDLLLRGDSDIDLRLQDGDRIIVPPIGPTIAIAGEVKRPGVYELAPAMDGLKATADAPGLTDVLEMAGGALSPGHNRMLMLSITPGGEEKVGDVSDQKDPVFEEGSILLVEKGDERREGQVELRGETRRPGLYALARSKSLSKLLESEDVMGADVYPLIGVIERRDEKTLSTALLDFPPRLVLQGSFDRKLKEGDVVRLFSMQQIRDLNEDGPKEKDEKKGDHSDKDDAKNQDEITPEIKNFLKERFAFVRGAARNPGAYPVAEGATLDSLLDAAGGLTVEGSASDIEVAGAGETGARRIRVDLRKTPGNSVPIGPGDAVRVNQKFQRVEDKSVLIMGEVKNPGRYDLLPGDKVSDLLARAGGLTQDAYPDGAIFSRESERMAEEARFKSQAMAIRRAVSAALAQDEKKVDAGKLTEARALAEQLANAEGVGRITVEANPAALRANPDLDMLLEPGDRLYMPKRSLTVRVSGEALSPATLQFRKGKKPLDYIYEAGGFAFDADKDRTFVLYPDGSAQPLEVGAWNYKPVFIPPGSAIIIPRDPKPFDFLESAKDISQILSNLAVTAIFINDVKNHD